MKTLTTAFLCALFLCSTLAHAANVVDNFSDDAIGKLSSSWRTWPFQRGKATEVYKVQQENGKKFLHASDSWDYSVQILKNFNWKIDTYPNLSWKWRAITLPTGANETKSATNDSACGVYVVFSKARQMMLKYTWSTTVPVGTVYEKVPGKAYIIIADSGDKKLGKWQSHTINVKEDYKKYFKTDLDKAPVAIAILTDGNAMHSPAECDYADFEIAGETK